MAFPARAAHALNAAADTLSRACSALSCVAVALMFAVVAVNVVGRVIFDATGGAINPIIPGAIEIVSMSLLIAVFAAFPASVPSGLVRVEMLVNALPEPIRMALERVWQLALIATAATLAWLFGHEAWIALDRGDQTQDLRLPLWPFHAAVSVQCAVLTLIAIIRRLETVHQPTADEGA